MKNGGKAKAIAITAVLAASMSLTAFTWPANGIVIPCASVVEIVETELAPPIVFEYTEDELNIIAKVIWREAGSCPWEHQCAVGCVVLNRVHDERFPDTVREVVGQPGQYSASYLSGFDGIPTECYDAARAVLNGEYTIPEDVVWQANFPQGSGIWWTSYVDTGWYRSTTYFCF